MAQILIKHNFNRIKIALEGVSGKTLQKAVARSIKRTSKGVAKVASMEFRSRKLISMKASDLKKKIRIFDRSGSGKPVDRQYAEVHISGKPESLARFFAKSVSAGQGKKRVIVSEQGRPYLETDRSFLLPAGLGKDKIILTRTGKSRLPVKKAMGPSLGKLANDSGMLPKLESVAQDRLEKEIDQNLSFYAQQAIEKAISEA